MTQNYRRTLTKHRKAKKRYGWTKLERIKLDCIWVNLKKTSAHLLSKFYQFISKTSFTQLKDYSQLCGRDFANERLLVCQFDV